MIPTNEPWCRDHGPIFLTRAKDPRLAVVDWDYNAWGGKYPPCDLDEVVPTRVAEKLGLPVYYPHMILEGGSIEVNGTGALLTTEGCLLNPNRNPQLSRGQIEQRLRDYLGVREILWLGDGIEGDDTDGHIDDLTRFVSERAVVTVTEEDESDANHAPLQANLERLRSLTIDGKPLEIMTLPMPGRIVREDLRLPASYANFYIANQSILLPTFADPKDEEAVTVLQRAFPDPTNHPDRLPGINLGPGRISLPDSAAACIVATIYERRPGPRRKLPSAVVDRRYKRSLRRRRGLVAAAQNGVVQLRRVRFARVESYPHIFCFRIGDYFFHALDFHQRLA